MIAAMESYKRLAPAEPRRLLYQNRQVQEAAGNMGGCPHTASKKKQNKQRKKKKEKGKERE